jgi:hypothetical protein
MVGETDVAKDLQRVGAADLLGRLARVDGGDQGYDAARDDGVAVAVEAQDGGAVTALNGGIEPALEAQPRTRFSSIFFSGGSGSARRPISMRYSSRSSDSSSSSKLETISSRVGIIARRRTCDQA